MNGLYFEWGSVVLYQSILQQPSTLSLVIITILATMMQVLNYHSTLSFSANHPNKENHSRPAKSPQSQESQLSFQGSKQKAELCKKFMEEGYCPFGEKCKFAHGSHELLRNNQQNIKYKTKECENFRKKHYCGYGKRCNFIHRHEALPPRQQSHRSDMQLEMIRLESRRESRMLALL